MQKGHVLEFACQECQEPVEFSIFQFNQGATLLSCQHCGKKYSFADEVLMRQIKKFGNLCKQIHDSEEILGSSSIGINVGDRKVEIPFKLLLTRLSSKLDLQMGEKMVSIVFRMEPARDIE